MKFVLNVALLLAIAVTVAGCPGEDLMDITVADLAGTYTVQSFNYESDDGEQEFDLATVPAQQGGPLGITAMTVADDGSFEGTMKLPDGQGGIDTFDVGGDIELTSDTEMRIDFDAATDSLGVLDDFEDGTFELDGDNLTLVLSDVTFDFTLSGGDPVPADLTIVATR